MNKCTKAFTLIELIIVMLIIALSVTLVFPKLNSASDQHSQLRANANRIASIAEYAQQQAACTHLTHFLNIDRQDGTYWITSQRSDSNDIPTGNPLNLNGRLPEGIYFADVKFLGINSNLQNTVVISFSPEGLADPAQISMTCTTGQTINIIVDGLSGQVKTVKAEEAR
jgi:prepilin-type N-terminal cleavage/methylation domain-containing protein